MRFIAYSFGGDLVGVAKTNSTARNQLIDGATDNKAVKNAVKDSATDSANNTAKNQLNRKLFLMGKRFKKTMIYLILTKLAHGKKKEKL